LVFACLAGWSAPAFAVNAAHAACARDGRKGEEERRKLEQEQKRRQEEERKKLEQEQKKRQEAERKKLEQEQKKRQEAERKKLEQEQKKKQDQETKKKQEEDRRKLEQEQKKRQEEERKKLEQSQRKRREEDRGKLEQGQKKRQEGEWGELEREQNKRREEGQRRRQETEERNGRVEHESSRLLERSPLFGLWRMQAAEKQTLKSNLALLCRYQSGARRKGFEEGRRGAVEYLLPDRRALNDMVKGDNYYTGSAFNERERREHDEFETFKQELRKGLRDRLGREIRDVLGRLRIEHSAWDDRDIAEMLVPENWR